MPSNAVDANQVLQAIMARMHGAQGFPMTTPPFNPNANATQNPIQNQMRSGIPGAASPAPRPGTSIAFPSPKPYTPTPFSNRGGLIGLVSGIINMKEKREHDSTAAQAEAYATQINQFLSSGDPGDQSKAQLLLDDPKVRKMLKKGLDWTPVEEEIPPEAVGIHTAAKKAQGQGQQQPQGHAAIPQPPAQNQLALQEMMQKVLTGQAQQKQYEAGAEKEKSQAKEAESKSQADIADASTKLVEAQVRRDEAKAKLDQIPVENEVKRAQAKELVARASKDYAEAQKALKDTTSAKTMQQFTAARSSLDTMRKTSIQEMRDSQKQDTSNKSGWRKALGEAAPISGTTQAATAKVKKLNNIYNRFAEMQDDIVSGKYTTKEARNIAAGVPKDAPDAPSVDGAKLKDTKGNVIAISDSGIWMAP